MDREQIARLTREEIAEHGDPEAAAIARRQVEEEDESDRIIRVARERRGH